MYTTAIVTLSDKGSKGERVDVSGQRIRELLPADKYQVVSYTLLPDDRSQIEAELIRLADEEQVDLILTTGGTGFSPRDVTPEATYAVMDRNAPGIAEALRAYSMSITKRAMLSRAASVLRGKTLIVNLPGSPKAVTEELGYLLGTLEHGLDILLGRDSECAGHDHHHHDHGHDECDDPDCDCHHHHHDADDVFVSWGLETARKFTETEIRSILAALDASETYGIVLRAKGIVDADDGKWIHFDHVPGEADVRRGAAGVTGRLCVIGSGLNEEALKALFGV